MKNIIVKLSIACVGLILVLWLLSDTQETEKQATKNKAAYQVTVVSAVPGPQEPIVHAIGIVKPRWHLDLRSTVDGKVMDHVESVLPGTFVQAGTLLAEIEREAYVAEAESANARIAEAKLNLAQYKKQQSVAKRLENPGSNNDFRLFKPHIAAANAELNAAIAGYESAKKRLEDTKITSTFDAIVVSKHIAPAQQIHSGDSVYVLVSANALNIEISLSEAQWQAIHQNQPITATIKNGGGSTWQAELRYTSPALNNQTRQRQLVLSVDQPYQSENPLIIEQQVQVQFKGQRVDNGVVAPASVLTRDNRVWTLQNDKLKLEKVKLIDETADNVMFSFLDHPELTRQLVRYPISTMLDGQTAVAKQHKAPEQGNAL